eukprot:TRINITY_DN1055_c0_g1_i2.p1 TRINITY_DN1055_c0_g1~~TRINITY_DN1055_c0_g1_i2.p1  ORF type:complete len:302 (-),score=60.49 TRINITY_DN1055_c0_g1_i2:47-907(-)
MISLLLLASSAAAAISGSCETLSSTSVCAQNSPRIDFIIDYPIWIPTGGSQAGAEAQAAARIQQTILGAQSAPSEVQPLLAPCVEAAIRMICTGTFPKCIKGNGTDIPANPCTSNCQTVRTRCAQFFALGNTTGPNCTADTNPSAPEYPLYATTFDYGSAGSVPCNDFDKLTPEELATESPVPITESPAEHVKPTPGGKSDGQTHKELKRTRGGIIGGIIAASAVFGGLFYVAYKRLWYTPDPEYVPAAETQVTPIFTGAPNAMYGAPGQTVTTQYNAAFASPVQV